MDEYLITYIIQKKTKEGGRDVPLYKNETVVASSNKEAYYKFIQNSEFDKWTWIILNIIKI